MTKYASDSMIVRDLTEADERGVEPTQLNGSIEQRLQHLANRNFAEADRIRDELAAEGIQLMDYKDPETGERRTKWEVKR